MTRCYVQGPSRDAIVICEQMSTPTRAPAVLDTFKRQIEAPWLAEYIEVAARYGHTIQMIETLPLDGQSFRPKLSIDTKGGSMRPVSRETAPVS